MAYASTVPATAIGVGVASGLTALGLMIWQVLEDHALAFTADAAAVVLATTAACMVLTAFEATLPALGGSQPLFSVLVIATGLVATFAQTAILAVAAANQLSYGLAAGVQLAQLVANAMMLAIIFSGIGARGGAYGALVP